LRMLCPADSRVNVQNGSRRPGAYRAARPLRVASSNCLLGRFPSVWGLEERRERLGVSKPCSSAGAGRRTES
jgi:hypothetical protein